MSEDCMSDRIRNLNMLVSNRDNIADRELNPNDFDSQRRMSANSHLQNDNEFNAAPQSALNYIHDSQSSMEHNYDGNESDRLNSIDEEHEPESSKNNGSSDPSPNFGSQIRPPNNSQQDANLQGDNVEQSDSSKNEHFLPQIFNNEHNLEIANNMQNDDISLSHHQLEDSDELRNQQQYKMVKIMNNNMFEDQSNSAQKDSVVPYQNYRGSAELIRSGQSQASHLHSGKPDRNQNQLDTNFSKSMENFKPLKTAGAERNKIEHESRRTQKLNMGNVSLNYANSCYI